MHNTKNLKTTNLEQIRNGSVNVFEVNSCRVVLDVDGSHIGQIADILKSQMKHEELSHAANHQNQNAATVVRDVLVIGGMTGAKGEFCFPNPSYRRQFQHLDSFHPAVLADLINADLSDRVVVCGFPGSGNGIVQTTVEHLLPMRQALPLHAETHSMSAFVANYMGLIGSLLSEFSGKVGGKGPSMATWRENVVSATWLIGDDRAHLYGIPSRNYLVETVHKTHEPLEFKVSRMMRQGAKGILILRHPLDIVVSIAKKLSYVGVMLLEEENLFRILVRGIANYYHSGFKFAMEHGMLVVRYEQCIGDYEAFVDRAGQYLGCAINEEFVADLKLRLLGRPVSGAGHLWSPSAGKHRQYLPSQYVDIAREEGLEKICALLDYDFTQRGGENHSVVQLQRYPLAVGMGADLQSFLMNCNVSLDDIDTSRSGAIYKAEAANKLLFFSSNSRLVEEFLSFMEHSRFLELVQAGTH